MTSNEAPTQRQELPQVFTVYPGQANVNYGFQPCHPQAPPPKYEDVINGVPTAHTHHISQPNVIRSEPDGIILVAPRYQPSGVEKALGLIFTFIFIIAFISIMVKVLGTH